MSKDQLRYCSLDGHPVVTNYLEAWQYSLGYWKPISLSTIAMDAQVIGEQAYKDYFGVLPDLPAEAFKD